jgi:curved DNA-binding protein CbpA
MVGDSSAYAALGLTPGADRSAIEQAYKRLIKQHHPDRSGGDARRAAEINRAYRELRSERDPKDPLELEDWPESAQPEHGWIAFALFLAAIAVALPLSQSSFARLSQLPAESAASHVQKAAAIDDRMDQPLHLAAIDGAARDALRLARTRDEMALASTSGDCHRALRRQPSVLQLDRCAAFDDAVIELQDRDPLRDQGPFGELAVTGRIWSGATALSDDSVAIDGRLDRIRLRVEMALAPFVDPLRQPGSAASN